MKQTTCAPHWVMTATIAICALGLSSDALADHVTLTNGDSLTGTVASISRSDVAINTELAGRVTIKWSAVSQMTSDAKVTASPAAGGEAVEGVLAVTGGSMSIRRPDGPPVPIDPATVRSLDIGGQADGASWHSSLNAGWDLSRGNSTTSTISTHGTTSRLGPRDKLGMFGSYLFSTIGSGTDSETTVRASRGGARYDHDVFGRAFGFGFGDVQNDPFQLLDLRTVVGGGAGLHVAKTERSQLNLVAGLSYSHDAYTQTTTGGTSTTPPGQTPPGQGGTPPGQGGTPPGRSRRTGTPPSVVRTSPTRTVGEVLLGQDLTHQLSNTISVTEALTYFSAATDRQDYRVSFDLSISAQLNSWLQWNLTVADRFLNIPPAGGAVQNDTFVSTGLGITFGSGGGSYTGADVRAPSGKK